MKQINIPSSFLIKFSAVFAFLFASSLLYVSFRQETPSLHGTAAAVLGEETTSIDRPENISNPAQKDGLSISSLAGQGLVVLDSLFVRGDTRLGDSAKDTITFDARLLSAPNGLSINSGSLFVDATTGRVGIGDTAPKSTFTVGGKSGFQVSERGRIVAARGIASSGGIRFSDLSDGIVVSDRDGNLDTVSELSVENGGTGIDASQAGNGQLMIGNGSGFSLATLTAGSGVTIANNAGAITISSTGGSGGTTDLGSSVTGTLSVGNGGTGLTSAPTSGQLMIGNNSGGFSLATLTAGSGISIASNSGGISISNTGVASNTLDFTELKNALTLDASTDIASTGSNVFSLTNTGTGLSFLVNDVLGDTSPFVVDAAGSVGIGTSTPSRALDIFQPNSEAQLRLSKSGVIYSELTTDAVGDLGISTTGGDIRATNENLSICDGGACPSFTHTAASGNILVENGITLGNNFELRGISATEASLSDHSGHTIIVFDEGQ